MKSILAIVTIAALALGSGNADAATHSWSLSDYTETTQAKKQPPRLTAGFNVLQHTELGSATMFSVQHKDEKSASKEVAKQAVKTGLVAAGSRIGGDLGKQAGRAIDSQYGLGGICEVIGEGLGTFAGAACGSLLGSLFDW